MQVVKVAGLYLLRGHGFKQGIGAGLFFGRYQFFAVSVGHSTHQALSEQGIHIVQAAGFKLRVALLLRGARRTIHRQDGMRKFTGTGGLIKRAHLGM